MNEENIVAVYDTPAHAELAAADLLEEGISESSITVHAGRISPAHTGATAQPREEGFWSSLFGGSPDHDTNVYDRSVDDGASVVSVMTPDAKVSRVLEILESHNPIDIDERASRYAQGASVSPTNPQAPVAPMVAPVMAPAVGIAKPVEANRGDNKLQLSEERLDVGKRVVNRGGTRVRRFVVENPIEAKVNLHSETVVLDRKPVTDGRQTTGSFSNKTIELMETAEEAVVSKTAHVYEEIGLRKEGSDRVETVSDKVRREEVEVVQVPRSETALEGVTPAVKSK